MHAEARTEPGSGAVSEDALLVAADRWGVFDGATSLVPFADERGRTGGALAAAIAREAFAAGGSAPLVELAREANLRIAEAMRAHGVDASLPAHRWGTTASVVRAEGDELAWLSIGDGSIVLVRDDGSHAALGREPDHDVETKKLRARLGPMSAGEARRRLEPSIAQIRARANVAYGVLNGDPRAEAFLQHGRVRPSGLRAVLLFTDGLLLPKADPEAGDDLGALVALYGRGGLDAMLAAVRALEAEDPEGWRYPRLKPRDDVTVIAVIPAGDAGGASLRAGAKQPA
jgi:serine/threonine protein phosphatase PrpC